MPFSNLLWELYPFFYDKMNNFLPYRKMIEEVSRSLYLNDGGRLLDVGCGTANLIRLILEDSVDLEIWGIDGSTQALKIASKKIKKNEPRKIKLSKYYFKDKLPFKDGYFDAVSAINFINYLTPLSLQNFIKESKRVLKRNGRLCLVYTNEVKYSSGTEGFKYSLKKQPKRTLFSLPFYLIVGLMNIPMKLKVNLYPYSQKYIETLLEKNGFKVLNTKPTYYEKSTLLTTSELI